MQPASRSQRTALNFSAEVRRLIEQSETPDGLPKAVAH